MQICNPDCGTAIPQIYLGEQCDITLRPGGVPRLVFFKCDPNFAFPYANGWANLDNWKWAICNDYIFVTGELMGQKPKGSFTKKRVSSCAPEKTISGSKTISFQDFNADTTLEDFNFWQAIQNNVAYMSFGWIGCDDLLYMYEGEWDIEVDEVKEDNKEGSSYFDGIVTMNTKDIVVPIKVEGLLAYLSGFKADPDCYS